MIDRLIVRRLWGLVDRARSAPDVNWQPVWDKPFDDLGKSFEKAADSNVDRHWRAFCINARNFREIIRQDSSSCWRCHVALTELTDYVEKVIEVAVRDLRREPSELIALEAANIELQRRLDEALAALDAEKRERLKDKDRTIKALEKANKALVEARRITNVLSINKFAPFIRFGISAKAGDINAAKKRIGGLARSIKLAIDLLTDKKIRRLLADALTQVVTAAKRLLAAMRAILRDQWESSADVESIERLETKFDVLPEQASAQMEISIDKILGDQPPDFDIDRVRELILRGEAPPQPWRPFITRLELEYTKFANVVPLFGLANLQSLYLRGTLVSDLGPLSGLANLWSLHLQRTPVTDLRPLFGLAKLRELDLEGTSVTDLTPLAGLANLRSLDLRGTRVTELAPLSGLANLQRLYLQRTPVTDLGPLSGLANLRSLYLQRTPVTDLGPLSGLANLRELDLERTPVTNLTPLSGLANLQSLDLQGARATELGPLSGLADLQSLYLQRTPVTDLGPLSGLVNLREVDLEGTSVTDLAPVGHVAMVIAPDGGEISRTKQR